MFSMVAGGGKRRPVLEDRYFAFFCVDGTPELATTYRIRYHVYCLERGLLPANDYEGQGMESDRYDAHAVHLLAAHRRGEPAGTARLVLPSRLGFPAAEHCEFADQYAFLKDPSHPLTAGFAEVSRLAVSKTFRRREGDTPYGGPPRPDSFPAASDDVVTLPVPHNAPEILIGLCRLLYQESKRRGLTHWLLAMERSLFVLLKRMGFRYQPAGPEIDYYGPVRPYVSSLDALERGLHETFPEMLSYLTHGLERELVPDYVMPLEAGQRRVATGS